MMNKNLMNRTLYLRKQTNSLLKDTWDTIYTLGGNKNVTKFQTICRILYLGADQNAVKNQ